MTHYRERVPRFGGKKSRQKRPGEKYSGELNRPMADQIPALYNRFTRSPWVSVAWTREDRSRRVPLGRYEPLQMDLELPDRYVVTLAA